MSNVAIEIDVDPEIEWWRPLVASALYIPHGAWTVILALASAGAGLLTALSVVVTRRIPTPLATLQVLALRERARTYSYFFALRSSYPPLATAFTALDPGDDPSVRVSARPAESAPRWTVLIRPFVLVPHALILIPLGVLMDLAYPLTMLIVAARRGWSPRWAERYVAVDRWVAAVLLYASLALDEAPRFGLAAYSDPPWSPEDGEASITELIAATDAAGGPPVEELAEEVLSVVRDARARIATVLDGQGNNKVLATMLYVSRRGTQASMAATEAGTDDPEQWPPHAASTLLSGFIRPGSPDGEDSTPT